MIQLTQGFVAMVDDEDFEQLNAFNWCAHKSYRKWYAMRGTSSPQFQIKMHQQLLPGASRIDHKDGNGLNNQKNNLRAASHGDNIANAPKKRGKYGSRYKGVYRQDGAWRARLRAPARGEDRSLGLFSSEKAAALAWDAAARKVYGEFACTNFPL